MDLVTGLDTQIFVMFLGVVVALGCTLVAFLVDYLKGKNERLREQVLEMTVRQEERARLPQAQMESAAVANAIAQVGRNLELVVRAAVAPHTAYEAPVYSSGPVYLTRPSATETPAPVEVSTPLADIPVADVPVADVPVAELPVAEETLAEAPVAEAPLADLHSEPTPVAEEALPEALESAPAEFASADVFSEEFPRAEAAPVAEAVAESPVVEETVAADPVIEPTVAPEPSSHEPDWHRATWHQETVAAQAQADAAPEVEAEPVVAEEPVHESLRSLFESPSSIARAAQEEFQTRLDEPMPDAGTVEEEPVVRIRVLSSEAAVPASEPQFEQPLEQPVEETAEQPEPAAHLEEPVQEELSVPPPADFLTPAEVGDVPEPAPLESFDSLMAAVHAEPAAEPEPEPVAVAPVEPAPAAPLALPSGMNDRATLDFLKRDTALFTGLVVSIGINDYARLQDTSGRPAAEELVKSVSQLVKSLITAPNGSEFFGCRASDDEFILVFADENGSVAQRRLNALSERLWDFQLRSLGNFSVMFSWGATEANGETFADAVEAASERMRETRQNRRTISMEKTRLKKVG